MAPKKKDINSTTREELLKNVEGLSEPMAGRILAFRDQHGRIQNIDHLTQIKGFSDNLKNRVLEKYTA